VRTQSRGVIVRLRGSDDLPGVFRRAKSNTTRCKGFEDAVRRGGRVTAAAGVGKRMGVLQAEKVKTVHVRM
jgi:hypothetical protein